MNRARHAVPLRLQGKPPPYGHPLSQKGAFEAFRTSTHRQARRLRGAFPRRSMGTIIECPSSWRRRDACGPMSMPPPSFPQGTGFPVIPA